ncbi:PWWP domain-containing protein 2A-like [Microplitis mediator]|uniref:PWWP domain-containing protein 2A-like n=1 Tax=Microplitis mediator TaxID=375433 RepID=UPI002556FECC|nr:PWWP domain-containing protein 2A-like [Microplitis mediator]
MAGQELLSVSSRLTIARGDKINVIVESALPDIIVVSFTDGLKSFQGALLDISKKGLPCGINPPEAVDPDADKLMTLATRFTYFQDRRPVVNSKTEKSIERHINTSRQKYKSARPTVRLRPRQVLCNKCQSICNEKNENVDAGKKRKFRDISKEETAVCRKRRQLEEQNTETSMVKLPSPALCKLNENTDPAVDEFAAEQNQTNDSLTNQVKVGETVAIADNSVLQETEIAKEALDKKDVTADSTVKTKVGRIPRKKRSVGSMEDLWDENIFEDIIKSPRTTPIIKISFGSQGEGTVLKIPAKAKICSGLDVEADKQTENLTDADIFLKQNKINNLVGEQIDLQKTSGKDLACAKAAKRALKKAKKEARRKILAGGVSPGRSPLSTSPRYNSTFNSSPPLMYHRRKHKDKHEKKTKEERKQKAQGSESIEQKGENDISLLNPLNESSENDRADFNFADRESYTAIKEQCLKQKLCISLRRLNANAYTRCNYPVSNSSSGCKSPGTSSEELSEMEQDQEAGRQLPADASNNPTEYRSASQLSFRFTTTPVAHYLTATGRRMDVGDIVWGKIHGFPWWPGKVLSISVSCNEDGTSSNAQAHVAWYGSSTCSLMSCDRLSPFLETFKARYNKKKRGPYKEAIRQAQSEAQRQMLSKSTTNLNGCESAREVNVLS